MYKIVLIFGVLSCVTLASAGENRFEVRPVFHVCVQGDTGVAVSLEEASQRYVSKETVLNSADLKVFPLPAYTFEDGIRREAWHVGVGVGGQSRERYPANLGRDEGKLLGLFLGDKLIDVHVINDRNEPFEGTFVIFNHSGLKQREAQDFAKQLRRGKLAIKRIYEDCSKTSPATPSETFRLRKSNEVLAAGKMILDATAIGQFSRPILEGKGPWELNVPITREGVSILRRYYLQNGRSRLGLFIDGRLERVLALLNGPEPSQYFAIHVKTSADAGVIERLYDDLIQTQKDIKK